MTYSGSFPPNPVTGQRVMRSDAGAPSGVGEYVYINGAWLFIGPAAASGGVSSVTGTGLATATPTTGAVVVNVGQTFDASLIAGTLAPVPSSYYKMTEASGTVITDSMGLANGTYVVGTGGITYRAVALTNDNNLGTSFNSQAATGSYGHIPNNTTSSTAFTVMACGICRTINNTGAYILSDYDNTNYRFLIKWDGTNGLEVAANNGSLLVGTALSYIALTNIFFVVYDTTNYHFYFNGQQIQNIAAGYTKTTAPIYLGVANPTSGSPQYWNGPIGKVGIWNSTALTGAQVSNISQLFMQQRY